MITEERLLDIRRVMIAETQGWLSEHVFLKVARVIEREALEQFAQGVKITIPTQAMEYEFQQYYRRGYKAGHMQGQEDMRERAAEVCDRANKLGETVWNAQQKIRNLEIEDPK